MSESFRIDIDQIHDENYGSSRRLIVVLLFDSTIYRVSRLLLMVLEKVREYVQIHFSVNLDDEHVEKGFITLVLYLSPKLIF